MEKTSKKLVIATRLSLDKEKSMKKEHLIIMIDKLGCGGAEILIAGILPELNDRYDVILVTLEEDDTDLNELTFLSKKQYILGFTGKLSVPFCAIRLRKIIKKYNPVLIHAHLFYSSLIARIATPKNIPLIYSLHNELSKDIFEHSFVARFLEKSTIRKNHSVVAVSDAVLLDYEKMFGRQPNPFVLKNYIGDEYFHDPKIRKFENIIALKLVAVANIKRAKNYGYLLEAFKYLKKLNVSLDIFGRGTTDQIAELQKIIDDNDLPVTLKGSHPNINLVLPTYDLYISSSIFEGFGLSVIEGMANGMPLLLSDIQIFREVSKENALFFDLSTPQSLVLLIKEIFAGKHNLAKLSENGISIAAEYNKKEYLERMFGIYNTVISKG